MEKIKEQTNKYAITISLKSNGYYMARISFKLGGGPSPRLEKSGTTEELALKSLLDKLINYIDTSFKNGLITSKIDDIVSQRLMKSINNLNITSSEIMEKTLIIVNRINHINSCILNNISLQSNVIPFYKPINTIQSNVVSIPTTNQSHLNNSSKSSKAEKVCIIEDLIYEWFKYRQALLIKSEDNQKPLSRKTIDGNHKILTSCIQPYFRENKILYLSQVTEETVKALLNSIKCQNSKHKTYVVLNLLFKFAIQNQKTSINPLITIKKPPEKIKIGNEDDNNDYIEPDRQHIWLDKFEEVNKDMTILFETMLLTGIRPEEACGLKWSALDLENNELIINNAYKDFKIYDENMNVIGHERHDDTLKTPESYRRIPLNPRLREQLLKHQEKQKKLFKTAQPIKNSRKKWSENEYMFLNHYYKPYVSEILSNNLKDFCFKHNLEKITPYGLRHSFATYCSENGMEEIVLMKLMGHSNFETTQKYYIRVSAKRKRLAMQEAYKVVFYNRKAS